ncbi:DUF5050 domain-containing protein [Lacrimispora sp. 210928-DFI.3.58]|uniref:DUF5050 domain-containing protein n=1 Tax=Lacrimispora sp. 210928-DFI.3.58 TaxID=2883214 RepID=UPI001D06D8AB|nr:DUF5050 domain-containing protein [Lacrimispora sp. 210928-DFI.3.58]MCB7320462.1 DUF5050 domain-containing protein [Lacrimispora sp. 210928-DFI.3.58]
MTKEEKLQATRKQSEKELIRYEKENKRKRYIRISFIGGSIVAILIGILGTPVSDKAAFLSYEKEAGIMIDEDVFRNDQAFALWSEAALHNDLNCLMSGGNFYEKNGIIIRPNDSFTGMEIIQGENVTTFSNGICSYINIVDDMLYYRKDDERSIFRCSIHDNSEELVYAGNVGEIFVYGDYLYFIDLENERKVMQVLLENPETINCIIEEPVEQFMIYSNQCLYLTKTNKLYQKEIAVDSIASNISGTYTSFFFNGDIIAQSGERILSFDIGGGNTKVVYENKENKFCLAGAATGCCYIQEGTTIKKISIVDNGKIISCQENCGDYVTSLLETADSLRTIDYTILEDGTVQKIATEFHMVMEN